MIARHPKLWLIISFVTVVVSLGIVIFVRPTLGIDFTGGSLMEIPASPDASHNIEQIIRQDFGLEGTVQTSGEQSLLIRTSPLTDEQHRQIMQKLKDAKLVTADELRFESIGPTIGQELRRKALLATSLVVVMIILYLAYSFRDTSRVIASWKFGVATALAAFHDLLAVTALFTILGKTHGAPIDTLFVTAQLAIMSYSVNDTIVIFNRLKSEWRKAKGKSLLELIDHACRACLTRSLHTSTTALLTLLALLFFGGATIRWFIIAMIAGTVVGTYSTFFVAAPVLYFLARRP